MTPEQQQLSSREAERITREFQDLAIKYNWVAGVCYAIPGETRGDDGALRVMGTCGGHADVLGSLGDLVSSKIKAKVILANAGEPDGNRFN